MMGQNSFVKTAFVVSSTLTSTLTLSLMVSALPSFAREIETPLEAPAVQDSAVETPAEPIAVIERGEAAGEQTTTSAENSEAAMSEFVKALSSDMAGAQSATAETLVETSGEVASSEALEEGAEDAAAANTLEEKLESIAGSLDEGLNESVEESTEGSIDQSTDQSTDQSIEEANQLAGASTIGELASVGMDSFTVEADSVPALKAALNSDNALTQLYAADALWTLTGDRDLILPTLISAAASDDFRVRDLATVGLSYLGRQALPAVPVLNQLLGNNDSTTRSIAQTTLDIIRSSNRPAATLGILARESRRLRIVPGAIRAITRLWR